MTQTDAALRDRLEAALPEIEARYLALQKIDGPDDPPEIAEALARLAAKIGQLRAHRQRLNGAAPAARSDDARETDIRTLEALKHEMAALLSEFAEDWTDNTEAPA